MSTIADVLQRVQAAISDRNDPDWPDDICEKLFYCEIAGQYYLEFYGIPFEKSFHGMMELLCREDVAAVIRSLVFRGPDEGANGTKNWDFTSLLTTPVIFPQLTSFTIEPSAPTDHNETIIGVDYDENGMIGQMLAKMPCLKSLTVPSAPDASFFAREPHPLQALRVETGYAHQDFLLSLSKSHCFPNLSSLDFGDYNQRSMDDYTQYCTPYEHYQALVTSPAFAQIRRFVIRNAQMTSEQLTKLKGFRADLQPYVVQSYGGYIR